MSSNTISSYHANKQIPNTDKAFLREQFAYDWIEARYPGVYQYIGGNKRYDVDLKSLYPEQYTNIEVKSKNSRAAEITIGVGNNGFYITNADITNPYAHAIVNQMNQNFQRYNLDNTFVDETDIPKAQRKVKSVKLNLNNVLLSNCIKYHYGVDKLSQVMLYPAGKYTNEDGDKIQDFNMIRTDNLDTYFDITACVRSRTETAPVQTSKVANFANVVNNIFNIIGNAYMRDNKVHYLHPKFIDRSTSKKEIHRLYFKTRGEFPFELLEGTEYRVYIANDIRNEVDPTSVNKGYNYYELRTIKKQRNLAITFTMKLKKQYII